MPSTGRDAQIGFGEEVTVGTAVTPTRFFEFLNESLKFDIERLTSAGLRTGKKTENLWVPSRKGGSGDIEYEIQPNGFGLMPKYLLGGTPVTTTPGGGTISRTHTTKVGALDGKARTIQVGRPQTLTGAYDVYTLKGCKVTSWELTMEVGGILTMKESIDFIDEDTATALATASYAAANVIIPWSDAALTFTIGGTSYPAAKITLGGDNAIKTDRNKLGTPLKLEQLEGTAFREYTGTIDLESYQGLTAYNLFKNGTEATIVANFTAAIIEGAIPYSVKVTLQRCRFDGETTTVGGPDILPQSIPYKALYTTNATTEVQFEVTNTDTTA